MTLCVSGAPPAQSDKAGRGGSVMCRRSPQLNSYELARVSVHAWETTTPLWGGRDEGNPDKWAHCISVRWTPARDAIRDKQYAAKPSSET